MSIDETHSKRVTFSTSLPLGLVAHFDHDKQRWIAVPVRKYAGICNVTDRLIGAVARALGEFNGVLARYPDARLEAAVKILRCAMHAAIDEKGPAISARGESSEEPF